MTKVFITKYCMTLGILEKEVEVLGDDMISVKSHNYTSYYHKGEWFLDRANAVDNAEKRLARKIVSVKKSLAKLEKLKF